MARTISDARRDLVVELNEAKRKSRAMITSASELVRVAARNIPSAGRAEVVTALRGELAELELLVSMLQSYDRERPARPPDPPEAEEFLTQRALSRRRRRNG